MEYLVFVGTYTHAMGHVPDGKGRGIEVLSFDPSTALLTPLRAVEAGINPTYLTIHPSKRSLYAVNENNGLTGAPGQRTGEVLAFSVDQDKLTFLNRQYSHGSDPCHLDIDPSGKYLTCANYSDGSVVVYPIQDDGSIAKASVVIRHEGVLGDNEARQETPHAHCTVFQGSAGQFYVNDLGVDTTFHYQLNSNGTVTKRSSAFVGTGQGPRHLVFSSNSKFCYIMNELKNNVSVFPVSPDGRFGEQIQIISTLPSSFDGTNYTADIHLSKDGRFLYGSNRGHDSIVIFSVDQKSGELCLVGHESTQGKAPRNFAIDPTGQVLLVANQDSHNIMTYTIDINSGLLTPKQNLSIASPVCIKILELRHRKSKL